MAKTIELLDQSAAGPLPMEVPAGDQLDVLRFIRAAGWVDAKVRPGGPAVVHGVTFAGQAVLEKWRGASRA